MDHSIYLWIGFGIFVVLMLALDLGVFHRKAHTIGVREALGWSAFWIVLALVFWLGVHHFMGGKLAAEFLTGYLLEKSLSVDNLFVFLLIFSYFKVPGPLQHKVLFWGILGALVLRAVFILAGVELIERFAWMEYVFGAFLIFTGIKMVFAGEQELDPEANPVVKLTRRVFRVTGDYVGGRFFVWRDGLLHATPLFVVLVLVESTDVVFAVDSIPAILGISKDAFIIYTSNVFAILGLRSLYFALAALADLFHHLKYALSFILVFVGGKMIVSSWLHWHPHAWLTLGIVGGMLGIAITTSIIFRKHEPGAGDGPGPDQSH